MEANPENIAGSAKKINKEYYYPTSIGSINAPSCHHLLSTLGRYQ
jgi:hypothetical protein